MATPVLGRVLSERFRISAYLGEGAMANVYRAQDLHAAEAGAEVALKVMHPALMVDPTFLQRFRREAKAAMRLKHPNTVRVIAYGIDKELVYIAMELLSGEDLFEILARSGWLSEAQSARIMIQICDALVAAHAEGIVHRDLKPENIRVLRDPSREGAVHVKVLDFGIAKIMERDEAEPLSEPNSLRAGQLTTVGVVVGTPAYMSPEQCRGDVIDPRSDLYSCGVLLYQLVTGQLPFDGSTPLELAMQQLIATPRPPSGLTPGLHPGLEAAILRALAKSPEQRQQSAAELKRDLDDILPELTDTPHALSAPSSRGSPRSTRLGIGPISSSQLLARLDEETIADPPTRPIHSRSRSTQPPAMPSASMRPDTLASGDAVALPSSMPPLFRLPEGAALGPIPRAPALPSAVPIPEPVLETSPAIAGVAALAARRSSAADQPWILVPVAVVLGIAMGAIAFLLAR